MTAASNQQRSNIGIVDSHCHASDVWIEPVETLLFQMDRYNVEYAVLVQINGLYDNTYQQDCVRRFPDRLANVVVLDAKSEGACKELTTLKEQHDITGIRLGSGARSPGEDPYAIWRCAESLGLVISSGRVSGGSSEIAEFGNLVSAIPNATVVLEHLGRPGYGTSDEDVRLRQEVFALSRLPNLFMKFGGVGEIAGRPKVLGGGRRFEGPVMSYHRMAYDAFGPERLMWGSDFPPVARREGYGGALESSRECFADLPDNELRAIFGGNAHRVFFG